MTTITCRPTMRPTSIKTSRTSTWNGIHIGDKLLLPALFRIRAAASTNNTVSISSELTYNLPSGFAGNTTENFIDTSTLNSSIAATFAIAKTTPFISYDPEFFEIFGADPKLDLVAQRNEPFADEAGVWVPSQNQVWFTSSTVNNAGNVSILDLATLKITTPNASIPIITPNGGYFFNNKIYITGQGTATVEPCIYSIDSTTHATEILLNSYFGVRFNGPNDLTWVRRGDKSYMFFTDDPLSSVYTGGEVPLIPDAVWRYDPQDKSVVPVISRADILVPNGIAIDAEMKRLYVTDSTALGSPPLGVPAGAMNWGSPAIYVFDLDEDLFPVNKRLFGIARRGIPDGIHIDDAGRVWTGEGEGVVVRNRKGKVIGLISAEALLSEDAAPIANFALAGDVLVVLGGEKLWTVKFAETVVSSARFEA